MRIDISPDETPRIGFLDFTRKVRLRGADTTSLIAGPELDSAQATGYEKLLQSIYDAVLITDTNGRIIDCNARAIDFFLMPQRDLEGTNVVDLISGADRHLLDEIHNNLKEHRYTLIEAHCLRLNDSLFPAEIAVNQIDLYEKGQLCFFVRDITVRMKAQHDLQEAVARLEAHDAARSQFVSNVSHELRTPLTSMIYAVSNMLRGVVGPLSDRAIAYLEMLDGDCRRLLNTVNDILDMRKIENRTLTLTRHKIPITKLAGSVLDALRLQGDVKSIKMSMTVEDEFLFVECDAQKVERVLLNVVGNAIKFTGDGGHIVLKVRTLHRDGRRWAEISVTDDGIGIPSEAIEKVTLRYFTVGEQPSGSGLGLAMAKEIVELHGGCVKIESPPPGKEKGTVVRIFLETVQPPNIAIATPDQHATQLLQEQLAALGCRELTFSSTGDQLLSRLKGEVPDVVILDLDMSDMSGSETLLKMKSQAGLDRIPVVALVGEAIEDARREILRGFGIPTLSKPWRPRQLAQQLLATFGGAHRATTLRSPGRVLTKQPLANNNATSTTLDDKRNTL